MKNVRLSTLALVAVSSIGAGFVLLSTPARSQTGTARGYVAIQNTSPGYSQSGHANISGNMRAGSFVGSGAGLHSLSGNSIASGVIGSAFLPSAIAMEDQSNVFTQTNTFNGVSIFNGNAGFSGTSSFYGFTGVGRSSGPIGSFESFGIGESSGGLDGMFVKTASVGKPYYGYAAGTATAHHFFDGQASTWNLVVGNMTPIKVNANGIGINAAPPNFSGKSLTVSGRTEFTGNHSGVEGVIDVVQSGTGTGIQSIGWGNGSIGVLARTGNLTGYGLYADNSSSGAGVALYGFGWGNTSTGIAGSGGSYGADFGSTNGVGARGASTSNYGIQGVSTQSHGVFGVSTNAEAVVGRTYGTNKSAVHGYTDVAGSNGGFFWSAAATGAGYGVIGQVGSATGYGVYSFGRTGASGTKSFRIDHPLDPENKYLMHYSSEGPEPLNLYSGNVVTGADGYVSVQLPDYYSSINRDPRVQLTVEDDSEDFVLAKVVGGIRGNSFRIRTSKPGVKVSWLVMGVRDDAFVQRYGAPVEVDKPASERGRYQHPELYNAPATSSMFPKPEFANQQNRPSPVAPATRLPLPKR